MSDQSVVVACPLHGASYATFVCQHLVHGRAQGFYTNYDPADPRPDAWCYTCDQRLLGVGEWTDATEQGAGITLVCAHCYDGVKERNTVVRPSISVDGWALGVPSDVLHVTPDFAFPPTPLLATVTHGTCLKALFLIRNDDGEAPYVQGERMWIEVMQLTARGVIGKLISTPRTAGRLAKGQIIELQWDQVLAVKADE